MIAVVLDHPQELVNIAHVVRAMKNFGVRDLRLVQPVEFDAYRIEGIAHRSADLLKRVELFDDLPSALGDCVHVVAFTARGRTAKRDIQRPRQAAAEIMAMAGKGPVALLFGREDKGLSNTDLDRAHRVCVIPSEDAYPSMNLGHAVAVALYELALARGAEERPVKAPRRAAPPADAALLETLHADIEKALDAVDFFKTRERKLIMRTIRAVVQRVPMDQREARLIRAMAIEVRKRLT
ncbi:MAG TPA: TrmJ/YjtD family RNA methyltransferase [Gemmatimonadales bacterium]